MNVAASRETDGSAYSVAPDDVAPSTDTTAPLADVEDGPDEEANLWNDEEGTGRIALGQTGFLDKSGTTVRPGRRENALVALLQYAGSTNVNGLAEALGHGRRTKWFYEHHKTLFKLEGPLGGIKPQSPETLMRAVSRTEAPSKVIFDRQHSNDLTGAEMEDIPRWAKAWFPYFVAKENATNVVARTEAARLNNRRISRSLLGASAPLGHSAAGPAELRTETASNNVPPGTRSASVGGVTHFPETIPVDKPVEGRDDVQHRLTPNQRVPMPGSGGLASGSRSSATDGDASRAGATQSAGTHTSSFSTPRSRSSYTGTIHKNVHVNEFSASENETGGRFTEMSSAFGNLRDLNTRIQGFSQLALPPLARQWTRSMIT